ncbi:phosphomannomutase [Pseudorhizobium endolithicum]|uniref:Phosphomannomutase n=1 Tax=Pseudorhizobium endolithicum TaxID=1191678 RepID=A0ABN7JYQ2_9HYPH|nr:phosphomannomutase [Pseudorhizobium endolithicum]CAD7054549.1 phosphomannomutase [Pseudorhizobium endolithicum]
MKFGTSGLRGLSVDLMGPASATYAGAFGRYLLESGRASEGATILLGRDFRDSSPRIAENCAAALAALGFQVQDCGTVPTPALALYGLRQGAASLMVTGSHIPADRNGIKFYRPDGEIDKEDEQAIGALAGAADVGSAPAPLPASGFPDRSQECRDQFLARNSSLLPKDALKGLRIGVYQHSTVARDLLVDVLQFYGADVLPLGRSDTFIPVDTEAVSPDAIALLQGWAAEHRLDALVSADGDGDRPLVADETGNPLRGDLLGLIAARFLRAGVVVTPVTSNSGIEKAGSFQVVRTKVGSPYVIAGMQDAVARGEEGVMGFEANGGVLTASEFRAEGQVLRPLPTRDCFLPILAVLALRAERRQRLSEIASSFALPVAAADRLENFATETSSALMAYLRADPANVAEFLVPIGRPEAMSDIDGLRITLRDGRIIHFRPSGNAPEMRCYVEAETEASAGSLLRSGLERIRHWASEQQIAP